MQVSCDCQHSQLQRTGDSAQKYAIDEWDCYFYEFESMADLVRMTVFIICSIITLCIYMHSYTQNLLVNELQILHPCTD